MDLYGCLYELKAESTSFESLQCAIRACKGSRNRQNVLNSLCSPCDHYVVNRQQKDLEDLAKPVGLAATARES